MSYKAVLRVKPITNVTQFKMSERHGKREDHCPHVNADLTDWNEAGLGNGIKYDLDIDPLNLLLCYRIFMDDKKPRKHGLAKKIGLELLLSVSPEYFGEALGDPEKILESAEYQSWKQACIDWVNFRFPEMVLAWRMDLDEGTPHLSFFIVPVIEKATQEGRQWWVSFEKVVNPGKAKGYHHLQSEYAQFMAPLGITRGRPKAQTRDQNVDFMEFHRRRAEDLSAELVDLIEVVRNEQGEAWKVTEALRAQVDAAQKYQTALLADIREARDRIVEFRDRLNYGEFAQDVDALVYSTSAIMAGLLHDLPEALPRYREDVHKMIQAFEYLAHVPDTNVDALKQLTDYVPPPELDDTGPTLYDCTRLMDAIYETQNIQMDKQEWLRQLAYGDGMSDRAIEAVEGQQEELMSHKFR